MPISSYNREGIVPIYFNDCSYYYNKKGKLKKMYANIPPAVNGLFNGLNTNLLKYILTEENSNNAEDW